MTGRWTGSDNYLPDWLEEGTESSLRDTEADMPQPPVLTAQSSAARSISSTSARPTPVVLTPTGGVSPAGSFSRQQESAKTAYMDLDKFYEDTEEVEGREEGESEESEDEENEDEDDEGSQQSGSSAEEESEDDESEEEQLLGTTK